MTKAVAGFVVGCALLLPARVHAQTQPPPAATGAGAGLGQGFGEAGQIVISGEANASFIKTNDVGWSLQISPAADYFIIPSVSVGGSVTLLIGDHSTTGIGVTGRAGYNLNFTEQLGIWPTAGIRYAHVSSGSGTTSTSASATVVPFYVPILYHIVPRVFAGIGPFYDLKVAGDGNNTYGARSVVGGWF